MSTNREDLSAALRVVYESLRDREDPPAPWSDASEVPWAENGFSGDYARAAVRDPQTSEEELEHIVACTGLSIAPSPRESWKVLDLGCGDGRLLFPLARMGHPGFGIDLGPAPVAEIQVRASEQGLPVQAQVGDLRAWSRGELEAPDHGDYGLVIISFGTLGALPANEGRALLERSAEALRPGGWLHLDLGLSLGYAQELDSCQEWWTTEDFVLGEGPQLVLDDHSFDPETQVYVRRSFAIHLADPLRMGEVRQTSRLYEGDEMHELLTSCGLELIELHGDFVGSPYDPQSSENLVVVARRPS